MPCPLALSQWLDPPTVQVERCSGSDNDSDSTVTVSGIDRRHPCRDRAGAVQHVSTECGPCAAKVLPPRFPGQGTLPPSLAAPLPLPLSPQSPHFNPLVLIALPASSTATHHDAKYDTRWYGRLPTPLACPRHPLTCSLPCFCRDAPKSKGLWTQNSTSWSSCLASPD